MQKTITVGEAAFTFTSDADQEEWSVKVELIHNAVKPIEFSCDGCDLAELCLEIEHLQK